MPVNQQIYLRRLVSLVFPALLLNTVVVPPTPATAPLSLSRDPSSLNQISDSDITHAKASVLFRRPVTPKEGAESKDKSGPESQLNPTPKGNADSRDRSAKESSDAQDGDGPKDTSGSRDSKD